MEIYTAVAAAFCYSSSSNSSSSSSSSWSTSSGQRRKSSSRWRFGRSCLCYDKRSVDVDEKITEPNLQTQKPAVVGSSSSSSSVNLNKECLVDENSDKSVSVADTKKMKLNSSSEKEREAFTFQSSSGLPSPGTTAANHCPSGIIGRGFVTYGSFSFPVLNKPSSQYELPRQSLDVFRPKEDTGTASAAISQSRRLTPDTSRRSFAFPGSPSAVNRVPDYDIASDSSSDLFEIESFSTNMPSGQAYRRDSLDEILSIDPQRSIENAADILNLRQGGEEEPARPPNAPCDHHPPSEVSVKWNVTTEEGLDRTGVADCEDPPAPEKDSGGSKKSGVLLSCKREKSAWKITQC